MPSLRVLGVMTGSSCDGIDLACLEFPKGKPEKFKRIGFTSLPYPDDLRLRVILLQRPGTLVTLKEILELDRDVGVMLGSAIVQTLKRNRTWKPDLLAVHGQTVAHHPGSECGGVTLQIGNAARIAEKTGITTAHHFRDGDMAAGGEGAPLVPLFHALLARRAGKKKEGIAFQNLGGMGNLTYVSPKGKIIAFDTGPANSLIDEAMSAYTNGKEKMDRGGKVARGASPDLEGVKRAFQETAFFSKPPPRSTGRDDFHLEWLGKFSNASGAELVSTATEVAAVSVADSFLKFVLGKKEKLSRIYFCGGGAKNPELIRRIQSRLPKVDCLDIGELGVGTQEVEAMAFSYLGYLTLKGEPLGGEWTGARKNAPPGSIQPVALVGKRRLNAFFN